MITGVDPHLDAAYNTTWPVSFRRNSFNGVATGTLLVVKSSTWYQPGFPGRGSLPPTGSGRACDRNTVGAIPLPAAVAGKKIYGSYFNAIGAGSAMWEMLDRLVDGSGINCNITTEQVINSVALPARATGFKYAQPYLEVYVAGGGSTATCALKYTNQDGIPDKVANTAAISFAGVGRFVPLNLADGDTGVSVVQSFTLGTATGAVGNAGITLVRPRMWQGGATNFSSVAQNPTEQGGGSIHDDDCLMLAALYNAASTTMVEAMMAFIQG